MTRMLRYSMVVLIVCSLSAPSFAAICRLCNPFGVCEHIPDIGTRCYQYIDFCEDYAANCTGLADSETLAALEIASVEVVAPDGVTRSVDAPRVVALVSIR